MINACASVKTPFFEYGFWWWFDPIRKDWFVGTAPSIQKPSWADAASKLVRII